MSSHVFWNQPWNDEAASTLLRALASQRCAIHELSSQQWDGSTATIGGVRDIDASYLAPVHDSWSSVMLPLNFLIAEPLAEGLSRQTSAPAIALLEYDQDAWGYVLYDGGNLVDRFWNIPEAVDMPPEECVGNVETVSAIFRVPSESISPYIQHVAYGDPGSKAFDDDEFTLGDHWVRVDFLRRLGLMYPSPGKAPGGRYVKIQQS